MNKDNVVPARKAKLARLEHMQTLLDTMKAEAKRDKKKADARAKAVKKLKKAMKKKAAKKKALRKLLKKKALKKKALKKKNAAAKKAVKKLEKKLTKKKKKAAKLAKAAAKKKKAVKNAKQARSAKLARKIAEQKLKLQHLRLARKIAEQKAALQHFKTKSVSQKKRSAAKHANKDSNTKHTKKAGAKMSWKDLRRKAIAKAVAGVVAKARHGSKALTHKKRKDIKLRVRRLRALKQALKLKREMLKRKLLKGKLRKQAALKKAQSERKAKRKEHSAKKAVKKAATKAAKKTKAKAKANNKAIKHAAKLAARKAAVHAHIKHATELRKHAAALTKLNKTLIPKTKAEIAKQQRVLEKIASAAHAASVRLHKKAAAGAKRVAAAHVHHLNDHRRVARTHRLVVQQATQQLEEVAKAARALATTGQSIGGAAARKQANSLAKKVQRIADLLDSVNHVPTAIASPSPPAKKAAVMTQSDAPMTSAGNLPHGWLTNLAAQALRRAQKHAVSAKALPTSKVVHAIKASRKATPKLQTPAAPKHRAVAKRSETRPQSPLLKRRLRALNQAKTAMEASVNEMRKLSASAPRTSHHPQEAKAVMSLLGLDADASNTRLVATTHSELSTIVCFQRVHVPLSQRKAAAVEFSRRFRSMAEAVTVRGGSVTLDAGLDRRYRLPLKHSTKLYGVLQGLQKDQLLQSSAVANLVLLSKASAAGDVRAGHALRHASDVMQSLSWTTSELVAGAKTLAGGKVLRLADALLQSTAVKLTLNAEFSHELRSVEMTYDLTYGITSKGQLSKGVNSYKASLVKHAEEELHRDPMKLARTLRLLAALTRDATLGRHLRPLFKSDAGALSEVHDTAGTLAALLQRSRHPRFAAVANQVLLMQKQLRTHMPNKQGFHLAHLLQPIAALYNAYVAKGKFDTHSAARVLNRLRAHLKPIVDADAQKVLSQLPSGVPGTLRQVSARHAKAPARHVRQTERNAVPHPHHRAVVSKDFHVEVHKATQHDPTTEAWLNRLKAATKAVEAVGRHYHATKKETPIAAGAAATNPAVASPSQIAATRAWLKRLARQQESAPLPHQDSVHGGMFGPFAPEDVPKKSASPHEPDMSKVRGFVTGGQWAGETTESTPAVVASELPEAEWSDVMSVLTP
jgi:hypothetical protein